MSNQLLSDRFHCVPNFSHVMSMCEEMDTMPEIRTFFRHYTNPIGIEVEVEGIGERIGSLKFWTSKEDGSLRNGGIEFVSEPLSGRMIDYALYEVSQTLSKYKPSWSHRTSIHIHQNVSTLREKHLMAYAMVYGLFEDLFYSMVDPLRSASAFCYKATNLDPAEYTQIHDSNKYCGLNMAPIKRQATIEFRQMHGTDDWRLVRRWIQLIVKLHDWIERLSSVGAVEHVTQWISERRFVDLARSIWGVNATLFTEEAIIASAEKNALWSLCLSQQEFR